MKTKLTLSVDESVVAQAKGLAARNGASVSQMFADFVRREIESEEPDFVEEWAGKLVWRERSGDPRFEYLKKKYG